MKNKIRLSTTRGSHFVMTKNLQWRQYCFPVFVSSGFIYLRFRPQVRENGGHFQRRADFLFRFLHVHDGYNHHGFYPFPFYHSQSVISCLKGKTSAKIILVTFKAQALAY